MIPFSCAFGLGTYLGATKPIKIGTKKKVPDLGIGAGFFFFFAVLGFEFETYTSATSPTLFYEGCFFKIGFFELFAQAGFEPQSS
jgi:hypothetical protein